MERVKALAFDTGGTILDWHSGIAAALAEAGARRGAAADWYAVANEYRRRSLIIGWN
jgi:2-haloacid dehalogenase